MLFPKTKFELRLVVYIYVWKHYPYFGSYKCKILEEKTQRFLSPQQTTFQNGKYYKNDIIVAIGHLTKLTFLVTSCVSRLLYDAGMCQFSLKINRIINHLLQVASTKNVIVCGVRPLRLQRSFFPNQPTITSFKSIIPIHF